MSPSRPSTSRVRPPARAVAQSAADPSPAPATLLDEALRASHVTVAELAAELGVTAHALLAWRYGRRTMPQDVRARAAAVLLRRADEMRDAAQRFAAHVETEAAGPPARGGLVDWVGGPGEG